MNYQDIPDFDSWKAWKTADGLWEIKLIDGFGDTLLHLSEDQDAKDDQIENGKFYLHTEYDDASNLKWIRERKAFELDYRSAYNATHDTDYVELHQSGLKNET